MQTDGFVSVEINYETNVASVSVNVNNSVSLKILRRIQKNPLLCKAGSTGTVTASVCLELQI